MERIAFWNNKGGTGKTTLAFHITCNYATRHPEKRVLVLDLCPQANLSELFLGGLVGQGALALSQLQQSNFRKTVGGYFQERFRTPYEPISADADCYLTRPNEHNDKVPTNIDLLCGDQIIETQAGIISSLSSERIPYVNPWKQVMNWLNDFIGKLSCAYDLVIIDTNPSFSIYTQIAIATSTGLLLPVMADDSSRRAVRNVFALVYGLNLENAEYESIAFSSKMRQEKMPLPVIKLVVNNRTTQYMGQASAYRNVLSTVNKEVLGTAKKHPEIFSREFIEQPKILDVRDFQTTGVVAAAEGSPFDRIKPGLHIIKGKPTQIQKCNIDNCRKAIQEATQNLIAD